MLKVRHSMEQMSLNIVQSNGKICQSNNDNLTQKIIGIFCKYFLIMFILDIIML